MTIGCLLSMLVATGPSGSWTTRLPTHWASSLTGETDNRLRWDATAEQSTDSDESNRSLSRPFREGYELSSEVRRPLPDPDRPVRRPARAAGP